MTALGLVGKLLWLVLAVQSAWGLFGFGLWLGDRMGP